MTGDWRCVICGEKGHEATAKGARAALEHHWFENHAKDER